MGKRYLITGASGQLGSEFIRSFNQSDSVVIGLSSSELDITNKNMIQQAIADHKPDVLINCAAYTNVDQAEEDSDRCYKINAEAPGFLADVCKENDILLVHFSTDYVFSGELDNDIVRENGYPTDYPASPIGVYGSSKWKGEQYVRKSECRYLIIRVSWLCGFSGKNFVKTMLRLSRELNSLRVVGDQLGSPSFTAQTVRQTLDLIGLESTGTFHIASDGLISWYDLASEAIRLAGIECEVVPITTAEYPTKARRPAYSKLDCSNTVLQTSSSMGDWKENLKLLIDEIQNEHH
jgi:dTDP-4-dehydrorhamnose reductase